MVTIRSLVAMYISRGQFYSMEEMLKQNITRGYSYSPRTQTSPHLSLASPSLIIWGMSRCVAGLCQA